MLSRLKIVNFTVFEEAILPLADGINVVIGSNGTGKSHLLKLAYTAARWSHEMELKRRDGTGPDKATLQKELAEKLVRVFRPESLGRLSRRWQGVNRSEVSVDFTQQPKASVSFSFSTKSTAEVTIAKVPDEFFTGESVFFPTKEMLSMFPGFASLYRDREISVDETYYDLSLALERPLLRGRRLDDIGSLLNPVEQILGGSIRIENGRFYLLQHGAGKFEMPLVAEGFRKLGALAYLLANGTLAKQSILFWDEPETNLNPLYMAKVATLFVELARSGTQIIIATHSLFMLRELSMLLSNAGNSMISRRFIALARTEKSIALTSGESAEEIEPITALDAEIEQSQRYLEAQS